MLFEGLGAAVLAAAHRTELNDNHLYWATFWVFVTKLAHQVISPNYPTTVGY